MQVFKYHHNRIRSHIFNNDVINDRKKFELRVYKEVGLKSLKSEIEKC